VAPRWVCLGLGLLWAVTATSCSQPLRDGPRLHEVPAGFVFDANAYQARSVLVGVDKAEEAAWFRVSLDDESSSIFITRYEVVLASGEVGTAYQAYVDRYPAPGYTVLEEIEIDGRPAWGFAELQWLKDELCAVSYRAIIPYETETFAVEFFSDMEEWLDPVAQREVVCQFEVPDEAARASHGRIGAAIALAIGSILALILRRR
jgi:hypothetical protein